eukprot:TRINITY_DN6987_c0_g2_i1.p1 TRINITY_DN6987_c0_g2~~TRINITY_DN6987_c0_g2_i1.p1  ORF type:complete len:628 (+),score=248.39 TRINITY_DN6987_c0_g2_i1:142-1884(+)
MEWRRLLNSGPTLGDLLDDDRVPVETRFFAMKFGPSLVTPWRRRYFIIYGRFLLWFQSDDESSKSLGCYYLPGLAALKEAKGKRQFCLRVVPAAPRRPGDKWKELIIAPLEGTDEEREVDAWRETFTDYSHSAVAVGEPDELETIHSVRKDRSGTTALGLLGLPPVWEHVLQEEGFTAEDFKVHRDTLRMVVDFARENQQAMTEPASHVHPKVRIVFPSFEDDEAPGERASRATLNGTAPANASMQSLVPHHALASLQELVAEGDPSELYSGFVKLDSGSQGEVYRATRKSDNTVVALKKIFIRKPVKEIPALVNEIKIMSGSSHPNIINFYDCYRPNDGTLWISMEYMSGGKLTDLISRNDSFSDEDVAYVAKTLCSALAYLHDKGLLHRDIKSDNVLIDKATGKLALADFGFGADLTDGRKFRETVVGTPYWMAPEVIRGDPYDDKADIWSLGILLLELVDGEPPNIHLSQMKALYTIVSSPPPEPKSRRSPDLHAFVAQCLQTLPEERATAKHLMEHAFLSAAHPQETFASRRLQPQQAPRGVPAQLLENSHSNMNGSVLTATRMQVSTGPTQSLLA